MRLARLCPRAGRHTGCAIGVDHEITDSAAVAFSLALYRAIAFGQPVGNAYTQACLALELDGVPRKLLLIYDSELPGFALRITARGARTYLIQYRTRGGRRGAARRRPAWAGTAD